MVEGVSVPISSGNSGGFTLIELVVAMGITLVALFGLLMTVEKAAEYNLRNQTREEVVQIGEERVAFYRALPFTAITSAGTYPPVQVKSRLRGFNKMYTLITTVTPHVTNSVPPVNSKQIAIRVRSVFKNTSTTHEVVTVRTE